MAGSSEKTLSETEYDSTPNGSSLPGYSAASFLSVAGRAGSHQRALASTPGLPDVNLLQYLPPGASISKDESTVTLPSAELCADANALVDFLHAQAALPPRPQIHITGVHNDYEVDFDLRINLQRYIIPPSGHAPLNYVKLVEPNELAFRGNSTRTILPHIDGGLRAWAWRFCHDDSFHKVFVLERVVPNWNTSLLEGHIRNLVASLGYEGKLTIKFSSTHSKVVVTTQLKDSGFFPRLFALAVEPKRYAVAQSVWPYANIAWSPPTSVPNGAVAPDRVCVAQSEDEWWEVWHVALASAMMEKRKGVVSLEDVIDVAMTGKTVKPTKKWGENS